MPLSPLTEKLTDSLLPLLISELVRMWEDPKVRVIKFRLSRLMVNFNDRFNHVHILGQDSVPRRAEAEGGADQAAGPGMRFKSFSPKLTSSDR